MDFMKGIGLYKVSDIAFIKGNKRDDFFVIAFIISKYFRLISQCSKLLFSPFNDF